MNPISLGDGASDALGDERLRRLSPSLDATNVAINRYRLAPGEGFPGGLHAHVDQEEVFVVLEGEATFETMEGSVTVASGEAIRFAPGTYQSGRNDDDRPLVALALGAPRDTEDVRIPFACPDCEHGSLRLATEGTLTFVCPDCAAEHVPTPCPTCDSDDLQATLSEPQQPVVTCRGCGATFDRPPIDG